MFKFITRYYQSLIYFANFFKSPLLLLIRLFWGIGFVVAGMNKMSDLNEFSDLLTKVGMPQPYYMSFVGAYIEYVGGFFLAAGFASRLTGLILAIQMIFAYFLVHTEALYSAVLFVTASPFNFLLASLLIFAFGPGRFSIDYYLEKWLFYKAKPFSTHNH